VCPGSAGRLGDAAGRFFASVASVSDAARTAKMTSLIKGPKTLVNMCQNIREYARGAREVLVPAWEDQPERREYPWSLLPLRDRDRGKPAVLISAGPSLGRNLHLLTLPGVRDRFTLVAVQTVLKPMLEMGVAPHFVCALDHHEMCRRFYDGVTAEQVRDTVLIAQPNCNPAIPDAFPGEVRFTSIGVLNMLLGIGDDLGTLPPGATVAHLAYNVARWLGCDPVVLIGQDLGFTDGQYYSAGASIHGMWGAETNEFCTLEMREVERVARMPNRATVQDIYGRPMETDEQMLAYLQHFEVMFTEDAARGLRTVDATEGGARKAGTEAGTLAEVLRGYGVEVTDEMVAEACGVFGV
jgi:hypothetical protein